MENQLINFEVSIEKEENITLTTGDTGFIFYLKIYNKEEFIPKIVTINKATYITKYREQLEQDKFLTGLLIQDGLIHANAFRKSGLIFLSQNLIKVNDGDELFCSFSIVGYDESISIEFKRKAGIWETTNANVVNIKKILAKPVEQQFSELPVPNINVNSEQLAKELLKKIERFEAFEEELKVYFDKISIRVYRENWIGIFGEIYPISGIKLERTINIQCVLYDAEGIILDKSSRIVIAADFMGYHIFEFNFQRNGIADLVQKIRLYPSK